MKTIIVAYDKHFGIGAKNDLLWQRDLPADLKHFKDTTTDSTVIMGYNTYLSIGKPLPNRQNIIISERPEQIDGFEVVDSLQSAFSVVSGGRETFVIGGGQIYVLSFDLVDRILATEVDATFDQATVFFPVVDKLVWRETNREKHLTDERNKYNYDFVTYVRR